MLNNIEIPGNQLKDYVTSCKSITFTTEGCNIHNKFGTVSFDLSGLLPTNISIHLRRTGGNGKIIISDNEFVVSSRTYQSFDIDVSDIIDIRRPSDGTGRITLLGFTVSTEIGEVVGTNWKEIINQCGKYRCLRLVKGHLFASIGGFIENKNNVVQQITTNPPDAYAMEGSKIRFKKSCEIVSLSLGAPGEPNVRKELYVSREPPTPIHAPQPRNTNREERRMAIESQRRNYPHQLPNFDDHILYDSSSTQNFSNFISVKNRGVKQVKSNNSNYLVLKRGGVAKSSISQLKPNTYYICIFNGKKLGGNGRFFVGLSAEDVFSGDASEVVFGGIFSNKYVRVKTGNEIPNSMQKLYVTMPEKYCHGEVLLQRVIIIEDLGIERAKAGLEGTTYISALDVPKPANLASSFNFNMDVNRKDDAVYVAAKKYARYPHIHEAPILDSELRGTIIPNNVSGVVWATRIVSVSKHVRIGDSKSESTNDSLLISHIGNLKAARTVWIEPFDGTPDISDSDSNAIKSSKKILSPSSSNVQYLKLKFGDKIIEQSHRPLPWMAPQKEPFFENKSLAIIFERDIKLMKRAFDMWNDNLPTLVVVGARGRYPANVIPLNEYYPYRKLLYLMRQAKFILDLQPNCDYHSSLLDMAFALGKPIVSSNSFVSDKPEGILITTKDDNFSEEEFKNAIDEAMSYSLEPNDMSKYNERFLASLSYLLS